MNPNPASVEIALPARHEYGDYYSRYIDKYRGDNVLDTLVQQGQEARDLFDSRSDAEALFAYQPDKWTIKELAGHLADTERVFAYRALRIARGDTTPLHGFDQDEFILRARFNELPISFLVESLVAVRSATVLLFRSFNEDELSRIGTASGVPLSVRAAAFIIAGHERHHLDFLKSHYLQAS